MKLSVVIPVFNGEKTIQKCLNAICNQLDWVLNEDFEVVVVNDGSTDRTAELLKLFPITQITLSENSGRTIARETGAKTAKSSNLLLLDAKVTVSADFLACWQKIQAPFAMVGDLGELDSPLLSQPSLHRLFFLLRRFYYRPYYPQQVVFQEINSLNFYKVPKGLGAFFCEREIFLSLLPAYKGKNINDDTRILHSLVFLNGQKLVRCKNLKAFYEQAEELNKVVPWWTHRGVMFADFILKKQPIFIFLLISVYLLSAFGVVSLFLFPKVVLLFIGAVITGIFTFSIVVSETRKDVPFLILCLPFVAIVFIYGITLGLFSSLRKVAREKKAC